ncbi:hypothetical protein AB4497_12055 [Vibrio cyclitrophicus]
MTVVATANAVPTEVTTLTILSNYSWLLSLVIVMVGWYVIYRNACKIATRSESKALVDTALSQLESATKLALDYWLSGRRVRDDFSTYELTVMGSITRLAITIEVLEQRGLNLTEINDKLGEFSKVSTLDAERINSLAVEDTHFRASQVNEVSMQVTTELLDSFHEKYKPSKT